MNEFVSPTRVLLTGGGGFLGAWILKLLHAESVDARVFELRDDGHGVRKIAPELVDEIEWVTGDITDTNSVNEAASNCDAIIHLAGIMTPACQADPLLGAKVNVIGTLNVFEAAKANGISQVVYTSSGGIFGLEEGKPPFPHTHYGAFKLANEGNARAYWEDARIASIGMRPFVIYGPGREVGLTAGVSLACAAAAEGQDYAIPFSGPVGLVYVEDVARAYVQAVMREFSGAQTINLTGQLTTVEHAAKLILSHAPSSTITVQGDSIPCNSTAPNEWATCGLDLPRERTLDEGISKTIRYYQASI